MKRKEKKKVDAFMKRTSKNAGFSLIEVLLAIIILGLVAAPILQIFLTSAKINLRSREIMAATDVANTTMEYLTSLDFEGDTDSINKVFTDTAYVERIPGLQYSATAENISSYASMSDFSSTVVSSYSGIPGHKILTNNVTGACLGVAINAVEYNNYTFDMIIWFESNKTGTASYYTYDVTLDIYSTEDVTVEDADGNVSVETRHFVEKIFTVEGAVANQ